MKDNGNKCPHTTSTYPMGKGKKDLKLGSWCHNQRSNKKKSNLDKEREKKLNDIHFDWGSTNSKKKDSKKKITNKIVVVHTRKYTRRINIYEIVHFMPLLFTCVHF